MQQGAKRAIIPAKNEAIIEVSNKIFIRIKLFYLSPDDRAFLTS